MLDLALLWSKFNSSTAMHFWADLESKPHVDKSQIREVRKWGCFQPFLMPRVCVSPHLSTEKFYDGLHHHPLWMSWAISAPPEKTWTAHASRKEMMTKINLEHNRNALKNCWVFFSKLIPFSGWAFFSQKLQVRGNFNNCRTKVGKINTKKWQDILTTWQFWASLHFFYYVRVIKYFRYTEGLSSVQEKLWFNQDSLISIVLRM